MNDIKETMNIKFTKSSREEKLQHLMILIKY